jgi:hypothetical protein
MKLAALSLAIIAAPVVAQAQNLEPRELPAGAAEMMMEMTTIQNQLSEMQERAMQHPLLLAEGETLGERIRHAMEEIAPETPQLIEDLDELSQEFEVAVAAGDSVHAREVRAEGREIEDMLMITQESAVQLPEIIAAVEEFETKVHARMRDENPEAGPLLERLALLNAQLAEMLKIQ